MTRKDALAMLQLSEGVSLDDIKHAYRRFAFALHPDLNPDNADASRQFQRLNEAYVLLSASSPDATRSAPPKQAPAKEAEDTEALRRQARKAYAKARERFNGQAASGGAAKEDRYEEHGHDKDELLRDLLRDPFARRVFEDIYSQLRQQPAAAPKAGAGNVAAPQRPERGRRPELLDKVTGSMRDWFQRQIDEDQTVYLPRAQLTPGARVRLQIRHGISLKPHVLELTLPPEFLPGRPLRLKGQGKRIGALRGDLYLTILSR